MALRKQIFDLKMQLTSGEMLYTHASNQVQSARIQDNFLFIRQEIRAKRTDLFFLSSTVGCYDDIVPGQGSIGGQHVL
jgi:hypothetical protein